jgi:hypothetical protein
MSKWKPSIGDEVYVGDPTRYPSGIVVRIHRRFLTLDTGTHDGLMPRFIDIPKVDICHTLEEATRRRSADDHA